MMLFIYKVFVIKSAFFIQLVNQVKVKGQKKASVVVANTKANKEEKEVSKSIRGETKNNSKNSN